MPTTADIHGFYEADPRRRASDEVTFGDTWTRTSDPHATYRLLWVADTGELYTVREPHPGGLLARYLDQLHLDQADVGELVVDVLTTLPDRDTVERALAGWHEAMAEPDSIGWVTTRVATLAGH